MIGSSRLIAGLTGILTIAALGAAAFAPLKALGADVCQYKDQLDQLKVLQDGNQGSDEQLLAELRLRKSILASVFDCGMAEVKNLKNRLADQNGLDRRSLFLKQRFVEQLDEALNYYQFQKNRLPDLGFRGLKDLSREVLNWKRDTYNPANEKIVDFLLWLKSQEFINSGRDRHQKFVQLTRNFRLGDEAAISSLLGLAEKNLNQAEQFNRLASASFELPVPVSQLTDMIKNSLTSLRETYQSFLKLSDLLKEMLPL